MFHHGVMEPERHGARERAARAAGAATRTSCRARWRSCAPDRARGLRARRRRRAAGLPRATTHALERAALADRAGARRWTCRSSSPRRSPSATAPTDPGSASRAAGVHQADVRAGRHAGDPGRGARYATAHRGARRASRPTCASTSPRSGCSDAGLRVIVVEDADVLTGRDARARAGRGCATRASALTHCKALAYEWVRTVERAERAAPAGTVPSVGGRPAGRPPRRR